MKVLVIQNELFTLAAGAPKKLAALDSELELKVVDSQEDYLPFLKESEIIFGWPKIELIKKAENLKWLQLPSAGADSYTDQNLYQNKNIILTNASGVYGKTIAEHVFAMILAHNRNLLAYAEDKKEKKWNKKNKSKDFFDSTIGILGFGDIGSTIAKRAKCWGAEVLVLKRTMIDPPSYVDQIYLKKDLNTLLKKSDYIILALPGAAAVEKIIAEKELKLMKKEAFIVNIGRGNLIDQKALIKALKKNWIAGAGLDVAAAEPPAAESALWDLDNLILTPHSAGLSPGNDQRRFNIFAKNFKKYLNNEDLINKVDFDLKY